ncbi:MAG: manganese efflux pump MntP family protein [Clostridium sp.]
MNLLTLILTGVGLSMDAFAVALTTGLKVEEKEKLKTALKAAFFFGGFQGLMPIIGWGLGVNFKDYIEKIDHWIAFILLVFIGGKMLFEAIKGDEDEEEETSQELTNKKFVLLAIATSIDALAVGVSFAFLDVNIISAGVIIAITTGIFSFVAVYIGKVCGTILSKKAEVFGGVVLILIGVKILLEHLQILG